MSARVVNTIPRSYLVRPHTNKIVLHHCDIHPDAFNKYAVSSLQQDNDARRRAKDEAMSIHIITDVLKTRLNILFEADICAFYGKPDFIIRLGDRLYIMVSTTRAVNKRGKFTQKNADRLVKKKLDGLMVYEKNLECLVEDVIPDNFEVMPVLHILTPNKEHTDMCVKSYNEIIKHKNPKGSAIKLIISDIKYHDLVL